MIQLIASDMDGTLLSSHISISEKNIAAIKEANSRGILFMVATGRGYTEAKPALDDAGIECGMITVNGAEVFDKEGNILFTASIDSLTASAICEKLEAHHVYFEIATTNGVYSNNQVQRIENAASMLATTLPHLTFKMAVAMASAHLEMLHITYVDDYQTVLQDSNTQVLKFIVFSDSGQEVLQPIGKEIEGLGELSVTSSFVTNIEINHKDAQKGIAVQHVAKKLGIPLDQVMTIGDNFNDVSMLKIAGVSFAMGNAEPEVKKVAKYETATNVDDGVGVAILRAIEENL